MCFLKSDGTAEAVPCPILLAPERAASRNARPTRSLLLALGLFLVTSISAFAQGHAVATSVAGGYKIAGTVVGGADGQPLSGAEVSIFPAGTNRVLQTFVTDSDGRFLFGNVKAGKYLLTAAKGGYPQQSYQGHGQYSTAVVVGAGLVSEGLLFRMHLGASITGTLLDDQNEPIRDAEVRLFRSEQETGVPLNTLVDQTSPDDRGRYRFSRLAPGKYFVVVSAKPWYAKAGNSLTNRTSSQSPLDMAYPATYYGGATEASAATPIVLKDGDRVAADIALFPVPGIRLRVRTHEEVGTNVHLYQPVFSTMINPPTEAIQGKGVVDIHGLAPGHFLIDFQTGDGLSHSQSLDLAGDSDVDATTPAQSQIRGVVTPHGLDRVPGGTLVRLTNLQSGLQFDARPSVKNEFHFEANIAPGQYSISVVGPPRAVIGTVSATGAVVTGHALEIRGTGLVNLAVTLERSVQINGIAQRNGKPVSGAMMVLVPNDPGHNLVLFRRDQSDSDGTFSLFNVLPGAYTLLALENAWDLEWANPAALGQYLKAGKVVNIRADGQAERVTVEAQ